MTHETAQTREALVEVMVTAMSEFHSGNFAEAQRIVDAQIAALEAAGVRLVPVEATREMLFSGLKARFPSGHLNKHIEEGGETWEIWRAMLNASPYAPKETNNG